MAEADLQITSIISKREWQEEQLFFEGDPYYSELCSALSSACKSIELEVYIFDNDPIGEMICEQLERAAGRGVVVRVLVDGFGSPNWYSTFGSRLERAGAAVRIYRELPWRRILSGRWHEVSKFSLSALLGRMNRRNHRKVCIFDQRTALVGSFNIAACHSAEISGESAWRDTAVKVSGGAVVDLLRAFNTAFGPTSGRYIEKIKAWYKGRRGYTDGLVRLNITRRMRRSNYGELLKRIRRAKSRVWIETAYFAPKLSLIRALKAAARKGADVRLLVPHNSDVFFMPIITSAYYESLLKGQVRVYEYLPRMLHAKSVLIDDWAMVGSTNLNHRSLLHDLEVDVVLSSEESIRTLADQTLEDLNNCVEITKQNWKGAPFWKRIVGALLYKFRNWL
ncbi:MAG: cardiolipin synthase B [Deltaproteobacteria bacterium]|nr:cardiolipin synthase B [Deltaproteobacteria bacterium]